MESRRSQSTVHSEAIGEMPREWAHSCPGNWFGGGNGNCKKCGLNRFILPRKILCFERMCYEGLSFGAPLLKSALPRESWGRGCATPPMFTSTSTERNTCVRDASLLSHCAVPSLPKVHTVSGKPAMLMARLTSIFHPSRWRRTVVWVARCGARVAMRHCQSNACHM